MCCEQCDRLHIPDNVSRLNWNAWIALLGWRQLRNRPLYSSVFVHAFPSQNPYVQWMPANCTRVLAVAHSTGTVWCLHNSWAETEGWMTGVCVCVCVCVWRVFSSAKRPDLLSGPIEIPFWWVMRVLCFKVAHGLILTIRPRLLPGLDCVEKYFQKPYAVCRDFLTFLFVSRSI